MEVIDKIVKSDLKMEISSINLITTKKSHKEKLLSKIIEKLSKEKSVIILNEESLNKLKIEKLMFNIFIIKSLEGFKNLSKKITNKKFNYGGYYVIIFENGTKEDSHEIFTLLWEFYIHNINLLRRENNTIIVETFIPFQPSKCNQTEPVEIAKYKNGKFITKPENFFPQKFKNFHRCPIKIPSFESSTPAILKRVLPDGTIEHYGRDVTNYRTLAEKLNLTLSIKFLNQYGSWGSILSNGTVTGAIGLVSRKEADFTLGNLLLKYERTQIMDYSNSYFLNSIVWIIPKGEPLSSFRKLIRPFDFWVWVFLIVTIFIGGITVLLILYQSISIKEFVFGEGVNTPFMNILLALFGVAQHKLPKRNFARFLLMSFMLFCLVIRSLYQGSVFQFLQASDREPEVASVEEMVKKGFTFYMHSSYDEYTRENILMKNHRKIIQPSEMNVIMNKTLEEGFKGTLLVSILDALYKNKLRAAKHEELLAVCKEFYMMTHISVYFPKNSYLVEPIDELLINFQSAGLLDFWSSNEISYKFLIYNDESNELKPMSIQHFSSTFQIWMISCCVAFVVFFLELFWKFFKTFKKIKNQI
ncbi:hypothetical protein PVAND_013580 [Polypedilum vanderplanki]|uniref:Uncharacterized protein n=1 Tax=Polypedilum vanderplanki TaxID=319348 RepID=A0A9J6CQ47_POLVA|nr:hypothetical protein PVAND_013580 [Polypedilum vanderplanki]